jgi:hypothetical protein
MITEGCYDHKTDGRWSRITHGLAIGKEIDEFKSRLAHARELFMVRCAQLSIVFIRTKHAFSRISQQSIYPKA